MIIVPSSTQNEILVSGSAYEPYVLNEKNKKIPKTVIENILGKYGLEHKVKKLNNFQIAMTHKSYLKSATVNEKSGKLLKELVPIDKKLIKTTLPLQETSYETLEFLGDAVIHLVLAEYLFQRYESKDPGFLTILRTKIEKGTTLNQLCRHIGLHEYAIIARNIEMSGGRSNNKNIMEDIFEAFMGALSLETSFENCRIFLVNLIDNQIDFADLINKEDNYKEMLMQYYHRCGYKTTPTYKQLESFDEKIVNIMGAQRIKKKFRMGAYDPENKLIGEGTASSKSVAEQLAAKQALLILGVLRTNDSNKAGDTNDMLNDDEIYSYE